MRRRGWLLGAVALAVGALAVREATAVARLLRREDPGGRADHAATLGSGPGDPVRLVLLGDSAVDGYGLTTEEALPHQVAARLAARTGRRVWVRSIAVSGATTADVAAFQVPRLRESAPVDAVVVGVGVNDAIQRVRGPALADATHALVDGVRAAAPGAAVAYLPCHDLTRAPGLGPLLRRVLGWRCRAVATCQRSVLADHGVAVAAADGSGPQAMFGDDGLHPGARGIEVLSSLVVGALFADSADGAGGEVGLVR